MNMCHLNQFFKRFCLMLIMLCMVAELSGCAFAPWAHKKNRQDTPENRVAAAQVEAQKEPDNAIKRQNLYVDKESALYELMAQAEQARLNHQPLEARRFYERVLSFSPNNQSAVSGLAELDREAKQAVLVEKANELKAQNQLEQAKEKVSSVLIENPRHENAVKLNQELNEKLGNTQNTPPKLKFSSTKPISLELREANIKVVFDALSRATGVNFILDKDIKPETKATIFVKKLPVEDAIDMVLSSNGLQKKILSENSVLVFNSNPQKIKDYQDLKIRSFYFNNTYAKDVSTLLKTMLKTKDIFVDERLNMLVMRDTPEVIRIAEKLVQSIDIADSEVMLDIEVLEVSRSRLQELGIVYPNQLSVIGAETGLTLQALKNLSSSSIGVSPNPAINFKKTTGDVNLISNPRIRVKNNEKAKILVGDKVPIITTTSTANVGISESVTYVDVGLKLDVEPRISLNNFVNIRVGLEVSSLGEKTVTKNGATVYTIGTRNANTLLRLKNGETQILAGLILDDERKNASKLPGLGDIPFFGRLFSSHEDKKSKTEIVLAITPRILSNVQLPDAEISEYWSGTESKVTDTPQKSIQIFPAGANAGAGVNGGAIVNEDGTTMSSFDRLQQIRMQRQKDLENSIEPPAEQAPVADVPVPQVVVPSQPPNGTQPNNASEGQIPMMQPASP